MAENKMISDTGYEIHQDINIAGKHYIFAINDKDENPYMVSNYERLDIFEKYSNTVVTSDYISALDEWNKRISIAITECREKISKVPEFQTLGEESVEPITSNTDINNKVIVIDPKVLLRESRYSQKQLQFCVGGFGAYPNSRGRAVLCHSIDTDEHSRFDRGDVIGVIKADKIPNWAKEKISELQKQVSEPITAINNKSVNKIKI